MHTERLTKADKEMVNDFDYADIGCHVSIKDYSRKIKIKIILALMYFVMKMIWFVLFIYQIKNLKNV